ncbi:hypothetical protein SUGI_0892810 [Cryptomeria japonica]|nr:hypothetical protein SUGI_0892810 [Cryptomeria japonica]
MLCQKKTSKENRMTPAEKKLELNCLSTEELAICYKLLRQKEDRMTLAKKKLELDSFSNEELKNLFVDELFHLYFSLRNEQKGLEAEMKLESECSSTEKLEKLTCEDYELQGSSTEKLVCLSNEELECLSAEKFWLHNKISREPSISPTEIECSSSYHSGDEIPEKQLDEWTEQEHGFRSSLQRKLDAKCQQEIVPIED